MAMAMHGKITKPALSPTNTNQTAVWLAMQSQPDTQTHITGISDPRYADQSTGHLYFSL